MTSRLIVARHAHAQKNLELRHGHHEADRLTSRGWAQVHRVAQAVRTYDLTSVEYAPTPQCVATAAALAGISGLQMMPLTLKPYGIGLLAGLSEVSARQHFPVEAGALEAFRYGVAGLRALEGIPGFEDAETLSTRIRGWASEGHGSSSTDRLVIASSSVATMLINWSLGIMPTSPKYLNHPLGTGALLDTSSEAVMAEVASPRRWPAVLPRAISSARGTLHLSEHVPAFANQQEKACVIVPGSFGNTRAGPYSLYTRLARRIASEGIRTFTADPLGCGESTPTLRSLDSEMFSIREFVNYCASRGIAKVVLVGHSTSANIIQRQTSDVVKMRVLLAPLCDWRQTLATMNVHVDEDMAVLSRAGVSVHLSLIEVCTRDHLVSNGRDSDLVLVGRGDPYTDASALSEVFGSRITVLPDADHNMASLGAGGEGSASEAIAFHILNRADLL